MKKFRHVGSSSGLVTVNGRHLAQLRELSTLLGRLPRDCSTTLGSHTCTGTGPDHRTLTFASDAGLVLLGVLHPAIHSLRDLQRASELKRVRKALTPPGAPLAARTSLGSLSESVRVFDPELLQPLIAELASRLPKNDHPGHTPPAEVPLDLLQKVVAVDGSCLQALSQIIAAGLSDRKTCGKSSWRLHMQFRPLSQLPDPVCPAVLTADRMSPQDDERAVLARHLQADCVYVGDRGYEKYALLNSIVAAGSDDVVRVQQRSLQVVEEHAVSHQAAAAGVVADQVVAVNRSHPSDATLNHRVRRVIIQLPARAQGERRGKESASTQDQLTLMTSLIHVPPEVIGAVYRLRWTIETFFRFFKHVLGLKRLFSNKPAGVQIQIGMAIIAALLLALACGRTVGRTGIFAVEMFLQGLADEEEVLRLLKRDQDEQARRRKRH